MEDSPAPAKSRAPTPRVSDELANLGKLLVFPGIRLEMLEAGNGGNNMHAQDGISTCFSRRRVGGPEGDLEDPGGGAVDAEAQDSRGTNGQEPGSEINGARLKTNGSLMNNSSRGRSSQGELRLEMEKESAVSFHARDQLPSVMDERSTVIDNMPKIGMKIANRALATSNLAIQRVDHRQSIEAPSITGEVN